MSQSPKVSPEAFAEIDGEEVDQYLKQMMQAVNNARRMAIGLAAVRNRFETSPERCGSDVLNKRFSDEWMRRKPLFPLRTTRRREKRLANKGKQAISF